jgi:hypothetical protein
MSSRDSDVLLARLLSQSTANLKADDVAVVRRLMISYGLIEEAYELFKKGWIDEYAWEQWNAWLISLRKNPYFAALHSGTAGMFDKDFQAHVSKLLESGLKAI